MDLIESSRSQWFEVATQFRAIFLSLDVGGAAGPAAAAAARTSPLSSPRGAQGTVAAGSGGRDRYDQPLNRFVCTHVVVLVRMVYVADRIPGATVSWSRGALSVLCVLLALLAACGTLGHDDVGAIFLSPRCLQTTACSRHSWWTAMPRTYWYHEPGRLEEGVRSTGGGGSCCPDASRRESRYDRTLKSLLLFFFALVRVKRPAQPLYIPIGVWPGHACTRAAGMSCRCGFFEG